jgi:uncharacterized membrane protein YadS
MAYPLPGATFGSCRDRLRQLHLGATIHDVAQVVGAG